MAEIVSSISLINSEVVLPFILGFFTSGFGIFLTAMFAFAVILKLFLGFFKVKY